MEPSPRIVEDAWARIVVEDATYKDAKLFPGGSRAWDWNETGTGHRTGVQPADVEELVERGADVVVLSRGRLRRLPIRDETLAWLEKRGVETHVLPTDEAIARYNELAAAGRAVGGLFHSTC